MGSYTLMYIVGTLLIFLIIVVSVNRLLSDQSTSSFNYYESLQARNIGNTMVAMITSRISDSSSYRATTVQTQNLFSGQAKYYVKDTLVSPDSLIKINVTSTYMGQTHNMIVLLPKNTSNALPPAFQYPLFSGGAMNISGGVSVSSSNANANVMTNSSFTMSGGSTVKGFVGYGTTVTGGSSIAPYSNPQSLPTSSKISAIAVPTFNPDNYKSIATQVYSGDYSIGYQGLSLGTKTSPAIVYVGGNLSFSGGAIISGSIIFVVKGTITIGNGASFSAYDHTTSYFGLYSVGNIIANGGAVIYAQMLSLGSINISNGTSIGGSAAAAGTMTISGGSNIGIPASLALTNTIWSNPQATGRPMTAKSYYE
jgi:hypothetical protein